MTQSQLLNKVKFLYPIGTKYKPLITKNSRRASRPGVEWMAASKAANMIIRETKAYIEVGAGWVYREDEDGPRFAEIVSRPEQYVKVINPGGTYDMSPQATFRGRAAPKEVYRVSDRIMKSENPVYVLLNNNNEVYIVKASSCEEARESEFSKSNEKKKFEDGSYAVSLKVDSTCFPKDHVFFVLEGNSSNDYIRILRDCEGDQHCETSGSFRHATDREAQLYKTHNTPVSIHTKSDAESGDIYSPGDRVDIRRASRNFSEFSISYNLEIRKSIDADNDYQVYNHDKSDWHYVESTCISRHKPAESSEGKSTDSLPKHWCIAVTKESIRKLEHWRQGGFSTGTHTNPRGLCVNSAIRRGLGYWYPNRADLDLSEIQHHTEITYETFLKHVYKKRILRKGEWYRGLGTKGTHIGKIREECEEGGDVKVSEYIIGNSHTYCNGILSSEHSELDSIDVLEISQFLPSEHPDLVTPSPKIHTIQVSHSGDAKEEYQLNLPELRVKSRNKRIKINY